MCSDSNDIKFTVSYSLCFKKAETYVHKYLLHSCFNILKHDGMVCKEKCFGWSYVLTNNRRVFDKNFLDKITDFFLKSKMSSNVVCLSLVIILNFYSEL